jgi:hypothetical protein
VVLQKEDGTVEGLAPVLRYFWFISIPLGVYNYWLSKKLAGGAFDEPQEAREEFESFLRTYYLYMTIPFVILGGLQLAGGHPSPLYTLSGDFSDISVLLSWIVLFAGWIGLIAWVFLGGGDAKLSKYRRALRLPGNRFLVRAYAVAVVLGGVLCLALGTRWADVLREQGLIK